MIDGGNNAIRRVAPDRTVSTVVTVPGPSGVRLGPTGHLDDATATANANYFYRLTPQTNILAIAP